LIIVLTCATILFFLLETTCRRQKKNLASDRG